MAICRSLFSCGEGRFGREKIFFKTKGTAFGAKKSEKLNEFVLFLES